MNTNQKSIIKADLSTFKIDQKFNFGSLQQQQEEPIQRRFGYLMKKKVSLSQKLNQQKMISLLLSLVKELRFEILKFEKYSMKYKLVKLSTKELHLRLCSKSVQNLLKFIVLGILITH